MSLVNELIKELIDDKQVTAVYGGGFKPPIQGHFYVVEKALEEFPEIDKFIIYVGGGVRDGISQDESLLVWNIYKKYLGDKIEIIPSKSPIGDVLRYGKNNPDEVVYFVIGGREGREDDVVDIASRTKGVKEKYPNMEVKVLTTTNPEMSGTNARKALKVSEEEFIKYLPPQLADDEKIEVYNLVSPVVKEGDTYEKMAAKGKKAGSLKQGTVKKRLGIPKDKKIPLSLINKEISRLKKMDKDPDKKGAQLGDKNQKYYKALQLAKTLKSTTHVNEGIIDINPEEEKLLNKVAKEYIIPALKNRTHDKVLAAINYKLSNGENGRVGFYIFNDPKGGMAHFRAGDYKSLDDQLIGVNAYYYELPFAGSLERIYTTLTGDSPYENLLSSLRHELIHSKDPGANDEVFSTRQHGPELSDYYASWIEFPAQTGELLLSIKNNLLNFTKKRLTTNDTEYLSKVLQDILDFYSGNKRKLEDYTLDFFNSIDKTSFQKFMSRVIDFGGDILGIATTPNWTKSDTFSKFFYKLNMIKKHNPEGFKEFQKDLYKLIQNQIEQINKNLPQGIKPIYAGGKNRLNENASYSKDINIIEKCAELTNYMRDKGYKIDPLPSVEFINGDTENARDFFGKTAYYDPNEQKIVLYTEGRHPKDIVRSYAHEMIHHIQNLEGRLGAITTQNTQEDDHLNDIEAEANLKGTMTFRNWTDSLNEAIVNEEIDLDKYVEDWLGRGGVHDNSSINRVFVLKLKQLGYEDFGTIYRILFIKNATKILDLREYIWANYNGKNISFSKTLEGAKNFMGQLIDQDLLKKGETFVIIKQKSNYYDLSGWVENKIKEAGGPWSFATVKDHWTGGLYRETQKTQEVLSTLNNNFEIEGRYSKRGKSLNEDGQKISNKNMDDYKKSNNPSGKVKDPFGLNAYAQELARGLEEELEEGRKKKKDPKKGTGKKPEGSGRRLYTDEDPKDTIGIKFSTRQDIVDTLNKKSFKAKSHARQSQIINLIHQRVRAAYNRAKKPDVKKRLKTALDYIEKRKEASKKKTQRLKKLKEQQLDRFGGDAAPESQPKIPFEERLAYYKDYYINVSPSTFDIVTEDGTIVIGGLDKPYPKDFNDVNDTRQVPVNENVPDVKDDGKAAPYGSGYEKLDEGRYDTLANKLSSIAFEAFKDIHDRGDKEGSFKFRVDHPDDEHDIPSEEFYFDFEGVVEITDDEYNVDGGANAGFDTKGNEITPLLSVKFKIPKNPTQNPSWEDISFDIKDVVRHELEHLTQDGENEKGGAWHEDPKLRRPSKYMEDDQMLRDLIDLNFLPKADYFRLEKEVDAMLQGLYFKAKKSKRPFKDVVNTYLDIFTGQETITQEEKENILDIWRSRAKALSLPVFESKYKLGKVLKEEEVEQQYTIYCDMDGVLTNFDKQFKELSGGIAPKDYEDKYGKDAFWSLISEGGVGYWVGMPWMPNGKQLWEYISKYNPIILSAPSRENESRLGKRLWVRNNLKPKPKLILASAANKPNYSTRNKILIDDRPDTIDNWNTKGGTGILFKSTSQVIEELKKLGL